MEGSRNIAICMYSSVCGNATLSTHCFCFAQICIQTMYCCPAIAYPVSKSVVNIASAMHYIRRTQTTIYDVFSHTKYLNTNIATHRSATKCFSLQTNVELLKHYYTPTNALLYIILVLKLTLKCLKSSYMFRSLDHPQGAYIVPC